MSSGRAGSDHLLSMRLSMLTFRVRRLNTKPNVVVAAVAADGGGDDDILVGP